MRFATHVTRVKTPVRLMVGLAVGAMLITATAFAYQGLNQNKASSETTQPFPNSSYFGTIDQRELILERFELIKDLEAMGIPWRMDDQGMVVVGEPQKPVVDHTLSNLELERTDDLLLPDTPYYRNPDWRERPIAMER